MTEHGPEYTARGLPSVYSAAAALPRRWPHAGPDCNGRKPSGTPRAYAIRCLFLGQNEFHVVMRTGNDMHGKQLAYARRSGCARVHRGLDSADIAANHNRYQSGSDLLGSNQCNLSRFYHCVCCFDSCCKSSCLNHS